MFKTLRISLIVLISMQLIYADSKKPSWTDSRPVSKVYYIGIGSASKIDNPEDYRKIAKDEALQDLSSEIQINISGEFVRTISEQGAFVEDEIRSMVQTKTKANLEGYEIADSWENNEEYWVYYRLSKEVYVKLKKGREVKVKHLALDLYLKGQESENSNDLSSALRYYSQAMNMLDEFIGEPLEIEYQNKNIYLQNSLFSAIQSSLGLIKLKSLNPSIKAKSNMPLSESLKVKAAAEKNGAPVPISGLPVKFYFVKGKGKLLARSSTNADGTASSQVSMVEASDKIQIIKAGVDMKSLAGSQASPLVLGLLKSLNVPEARFILQVSGLTAYIESNEVSLGEKLDVLKIEPKLKEALADAGFSFTDDISQAEIMIKIEASARQGSKVYNLFSAFADINLSITDLTTGEEVYKKAFNVKGIQLDFTRAGLEALKKAGEKMEEFAPEISKKIMK